MCFAGPGGDWQREWRPGSSGVRSFVGTVSWDQADEEVYVGFSHSWREEGITGVSWQIMTHSVLVVFLSGISSLVSKSLVRFCCTVYSFDG